MRKEYDFSKSKKNPYASKLKKQITIRLDQSTVDYFKNLADSFGIPYQNLINLFLRDCASKKLKPELSWESSVDQDQSPISSGKGKSKNP